MYQILDDIAHIGMLGRYQECTARPAQLSYMRYTVQLYVVTEAYFGMCPIR